MPASQLLRSTIVLLCTVGVGESVGQSVVAGHVLDRVSGNGVSEALVTLSWTSDSVSQRVGRAGKFSFNGLAPGTVHLLVRAIGFEALEATLDLRGADTVAIDVELDRVVQILDSIVVEVSEPLPAGLRAFESRRRMGGGGYYMDRQAISEYDNRSTAIMVAAFAGIRVVPREGRGGYVVASSRGARANAGSLGNPGSTTCYAQVIVDGVRVWQPGATTEPPPDIERFAARELAAVEYYPGPAATPSEFSGLGASCGTLVIWTRFR